MIPLLFLLVSNLFALDVFPPAINGQTISVDSASVTGNFFSVGGSTFVVKGGLVGIGMQPSVADTLRILPHATSKGVAIRESDDGNDAIRAYASATRGVVDISNGGSVSISLDGASNSTFYGSTLTVASGGVVTAPQQPSIRAWLNYAPNCGTGVATTMFFDSEDYDRQFNHSVSASSQNFTVPPSAGGLYLLSATLGFASAANGVRQTIIQVGGVTACRGQQPGGAGATGNDVTATCVQVLAAGDVVTVQAFQSSGATLAVNSSQSSSFFNAVKLW